MIDTWSDGWGHFWELVLLGFQMCISVQTSLSPRPQIGLRAYYTPHHERGAVEKGIDSLEQTLGIPILHVCSLAQSYLTLGDPMDCSPPGSSVHGISQARILEWVITSFPILLTVNSGVVDNTETEKAVAPHSSTLAWKIPWTGEPGGLQSMGLRRVGHNWATSLSLSLSCIGEENGNPL